MTDFESTFKAKEKLELIKARSETALKLALTDTVARLQRRIGKGQGVNGERYNYSQASLKKGKKNPVNWTDTGTLRGSIDYESKISNNELSGLIGVKNINRGKITNSRLLKYLIEMFPNIWGLSKDEMKKFRNDFFKFFKR